MPDRSTFRRNRGSTSRSGGVSRRKKQWLGSVIATPTTIASGASVALTVVSNANIILAEGGGGKGTILRTRGWIHISRATNLQDPVVVMGLAVVDERARAIGVTALPTANDLEDLFWFGGAGFSDLGTGVEGLRLEVDSKAMRKYDATDAIVLVVSGEASGHSAEMLFSIDCLLAEE